MQLGYDDFSQEGWTMMIRGGEPMARVNAAGKLAGAKHLIAAGILTQEQVDTIIRLLHDPAFYYQGLTMFSAWGRKPIADQGICIE